MPVSCEVRVPTYRRPKLLRRALESLRDQTMENWRAVVYDDSPDYEGAAIVRALRDSRIVYRQNASRLGAAGNLDQAFDSAPAADGACAFVLEDDAALLPQFLAENLSVFHSCGAHLLLRNQAIYEGDGPTWHDTGETTRGKWLDEGIHAPLDIRALQFFVEGVSNGGLFWRMGCGIDLRVGPAVNDAGLQEYCRTLLVNCPLYFARKPLAVFTRMPREKISRSIAADRTFARGTQAIRRYLVSVHGAKIIDESKQVARRTGQREQLARALQDSGHVELWSDLPTGAKPLVKGLARFLLVANPVAGFLKNLKTSQNIERVHARCHEVPSRR